MPLITCEMRWFLEGALPGEVERWFDRGQDPALSAWRDDRYLILPVADMGIKWREGRLEIKGRLAVLGGHAPTADIEGVAERWSKWAHAGRPVEERFRRCSRNGTITVRKRRRQRHFLLDRGGGQEVAQREMDQRGFSMELTRIRLGNDRHWTLGIEAAPDDPEMPSDLAGALRQVLAGFPIALPRARSMSYPQWLARPRAGPTRS